MYCRGRQPDWRLARQAAILPALIVVVALATACGSSGGGPAPAGVLGPAPNQAQTLGAIPLGVPSAAPPCAGSTDVPAPVAQGLQSLASACVNRWGSEMVVTNLSVFALDIGSANNTSPSVTISPPDAAGYPSPAEQLELDTQTQAATGVTTRAGTVLLPVGDQLHATTGTPPIQLTVQADMLASRATFAAASLSAYTVESFTQPLPETLYPYTALIVNCVKAAYSSATTFSQPAPSSSPSPSVADLIQHALKTIVACGQLYKKLKDDVNANPPADEHVQPDLAPKLEQARQDLESKAEEAPREPIRLVP